MNKSDAKMSCFTFSLTTLCMTILLIICCFVKLDNMNNKLKIMEKQIIECSYTIDIYSEKVEDYKKRVEDYTLFVDSVSRKVVDKEW